MAQIADDEDGIDVRTKLNDTGLRKNNFAATTDPGVGDDTADGYEVGSKWANVTADRIFVAIDVTEGAAVWLQMGVHDADTLKSDVTATLTAGYGNTPENLGTITTGTVTPDVADGHMQRLVNGGAFTLAVPSADCEILIQITNNSSAGAITTSAYTSVVGEFTTTDGDDFFARITRCNGFTSLIIQALQ
jgi:hypothetical protein